MAETQRAFHAEQGLERWIAERLVKTASVKAEDHASSAGMVADYRRWCDAEGYPPVSQVDQMAQVRDVMECAPYLCREGKARRTRYYQLALRSDADG